MAERQQGWSSQFEDLISMPGGRRLITLRDAATYITALPKEEAADPSGRRRSKL
jgi:hypothetical protein